MGGWGSKPQERKEELPARPWRTVEGYIKQEEKRRNGEGSSEQKGEAK